MSRYSGGLDHVFETTTAGVTIMAPQLDIHTVAAGGIVGCHDIQVVADSFIEMGFLWLVHRVHRPIRGLFHIARADH